VPDKKSFFNINIEGTKSCLEAALEEEIEKVIYTSSVAAVGYVESDKPANEETEFNDLNGSPYVQSKYFGEQEALSFYKKGLPVVIVNPAGVLGVRDIKPTPSGAAIVNLMNRKMPGYINSGVNLVDVEDVARGHILAAQKGKTGERYILGNENIRIKEFLN
jgi:dihydroflavonol-4-reductase